MQLTSSLLLLSFIAATFCSPVPDAPVANGTSVCAMPLGTDLTTMPQLMNDIFLLQSSDAMTLKANEQYTVSQQYISINIDVDTDDTAYSTEDFNLNVLKVFSSCAKGVSTHDMSLDPKLTKMGKEFCQLQANNNKSKNNKLLGMLNDKGAVIVLCYHIPPV